MELPKITGDFINCSFLTSIVALKMVMVLFTLMMICYSILYYASLTIHYSFAEIRNIPNKANAKTTNKTKDTEKRKKSQRILNLPTSSILMKESLIRVINEQER